MKMLPAVIKENESEATGPKTGKRKRYRRIIIPNVRVVPPAAIILNRFLKNKNAAPAPNPNNPVVKGNTRSSLG